MAEWTLYHNPKCGTARKVKDRLEQAGIRAKVVEYLKNPPSVAELEGLLKKLGAGPEAITRTKEAPWQARKPDPAVFPRRDWLTLIAENPILLQRPIVVKDDKAVVARPPEKLDSLLRAP